MNNVIKFIIISLLLGGLTVHGFTMLINFYELDIPSILRFFMGIVIGTVSSIITIYSLKR